MGDEICGNSPSTASKLGTGLPEVFLVTMAVYYVWRGTRRQFYSSLTVFMAMTEMTCKIFITYVSCIPKMLQDTGAVSR